jgi:hypothetical protein
VASTALRTRTTDYGDYDEVVVNRLIAGQHPGGPISAPDAAEATRRLRRRSVVRIRQRLGIPAALTPRQNQFDRQHAAPNRPRKAG